MAKMFLRQESGPEKDRRERDAFRVAIIWAAVLFFAVAAFVAATAFAIDFSAFAVLVLIVVLSVGAHALMCSVIETSRPPMSFRGLMWWLLILASPVLLGIVGRIFS